MRVLVVHTHYQQPGGEDGVFASEVALLQSMGLEAIPFSIHNRELARISPWCQAAVTVWNRAVYRRLRGVIRDKRPHVVHIHNTFPLASPAVVHAAKAEQVPVVMTLHNYRLLCVNALFFRQDRPCEDCLGRLPWPGTVHGCYRHSRTASAVVAGMLAIHRAIGTWRLVDRFIALTEFSRNKFLKAGFPPERVVVKPNFVHPDPGLGDGSGGYALFVGRLAPEKGVQTLLAAWRELGRRVPLKILGDGPLNSRVSEAVRTLSGVEWLGRKPRPEVFYFMKQATFLVFPSESYEGFPLTIAEAYATGLPVVASDRGAMASLVAHKRTGLCFRPGDPEDLAAKVEWLLTHPSQLDRMRKEARAEYEAKYTADRNYHMLLDIYEQAIESHRRGR